MHGVHARKPISPLRLDPSIASSLANAVGVEPVETAMEARNNSDIEQIDHKTCVSICDAIGERLQQRLRPDTDLSPRLRELVDELRRRDNELH